MQYMSEDSYILKIEALEEQVHVDSKKIKSFVDEREHLMRSIAIMQKYTDEITLEMKEVRSALLECRRDRDKYFQRVIRYMLEDLEYSCR